MLVDDVPVTITKADLCSGTLAFLLFALMIIGICLSVRGGCADQQPAPQPAGLTGSD
jgi:hypothetical protein